MKIALLFLTFTFLPLKAEICGPEELLHGQEALDTTVRAVGDALEPTCLESDHPALKGHNAEGSIEAVLKVLQKIDDLPHNQKENYLRSSRVSDYVRSLFVRPKGTPKSIVAYASGENRSQEDRAIVEEAIINGFVQYSKDYGCRPIIAPKHQPRSLGRVYRENPYESAREVFQKLNTSLDSGALGKRHKRNLQPGTLFIERPTKLLNCSTKVIKDKEFKRIEEWIVPSCSKSFTHQFKNNEFEITESALKSIQASDNYQALKACIQNRIEEYGAADVEKIKVDASSNYLANTQKAEELFGRYGFDKLSEARAKSAKDRLLPDLMSGVPDHEKFIIEPKYLSDEGASGPCPYRRTKDSWELKPEYAPGGKKASELERHKFVRVTVTFKTKTKKAVKQKEYIGAKYDCSGIEYKCKN